MSESFVILCTIDVLLFSDGEAGVFVQRYVSRVVVLTILANTLFVRLSLPLEPSALVFTSFVDLSRKVWLPVLNEWKEATYTMGGNPSGM